MRVSEAVSIGILPSTTVFSPTLSILAAIRSSTADDFDSIALEKAGVDQDHRTRGEAD